MAVVLDPQWTIPSSKKIAYSSLSVNHAWFWDAAWYRYTSVNFLRSHGCSLQPTVVRKACCNAGWLLQCRLQCRLTFNENRQNIWGVCPFICPAVLLLVGLSVCLSVWASVHIVSKRQQWYWLWPCHDNALKTMYACERRCVRWVLAINDQSMSLQLDVFATSLCFCSCV